MECVLITGAGGFLGSHLIGESPLKTDLYGLTRNSVVNLNRDRWFRTPITDRTSLFRMLDQIRPNKIIHTAAISGEGECRRDAAHAREVNVKSCSYLSEWCTENGAFLLFTSSDLVFDGNQPPYRESDQTGSSMYYGQMKEKAEALLSGLDNVLIVRLPLLYGIGRGARPGLLYQFMEHCRSGHPQKLFSDEYRSPVCVSDAASFIWKLLERKHAGVLHMGGRQRLSRLEMGRLYTEYLRLPADQLISIKRADIAMDYRPADTTLDSRKAYGLGFDPRSVEACLKELRQHISV